MNPEDIPLRELHLPPPVGWWPPAPGWWLLAALFLCALGWLLWRAWQNWRRAAPRRLALAELARLQRTWQNERDVSALGARLSPLLRRAMLAYAPRAQVAGLTGQAWLAWLDRGFDDRPFSTGPGRCLESLPYRRPGQAPDVDPGLLIAAVRRRLSTPMPESA